MMKIFFKSLEKSLSIDNGIYNIVVENSNIYRKIAINIDSEIILSKDNKILSLEKDLVVIYDPFNIDLNDSKLIKSLYKLLEKEIHNCYSEELMKIENILRDVSENIILTKDATIDYEPQIDVSKLLSSLGIKYYVCADYLSNLIQFIKIQSELFSKKVILFFGLSTVLNANEMEFLNNELISINSSIIDVSYFAKTQNNNTLIIDDDWCIL